MLQGALPQIREEKHQLANPHLPIQSSRHETLTLCLIRGERHGGGDQAKEGDNLEGLHGG